MNKICNAKYYEYYNFLCMFLYYRSSDAFVRITLQHSNDLALFSVIVGWIYFVAWSVSFYPQMYENWTRKR